MEATTSKYWEFPGGLVVRIQHFHCDGLSSIPGLETEITLQATTWHHQKNPKNKKSKYIGFIGIKHLEKENYNSLYIWSFYNLLGFLSLALILFYFCCCCLFLGLYLLHMEVPRLGIKSELQPLAYTTATATPDPRHVFDLHHSSGQRWILNPLSEATNQTWVLMNTSWIRFHWATMGTPH